jgi:hypothetical protein
MSMPFAYRDNNHNSKDKALINLIENTGLP